MEKRVCARLEGTEAMRSVNKREREKNVEGKNRDKQKNQIIINEK